MGKTNIQVLCVSEYEYIDSKGNGGASPIACAAIPVLITSIFSA